MFFNPSMILFIMCILSSIMMVLASPSLMFSWVGLELNTLTFIPLILNMNNKSSNESAIKYFLTQTLASVLFLLSILLPLNSMQMNFILLMSLMIKLGAAPFHSWLPGMVESLSWSSLFILLTIQKINPLLILINPQPFSSWIFLPIWLSLIVGAFMGIIQTHTRSLMTYSSINHMGWMLVAWNSDNFSLIYYFTLYIILLIPLIILFHKTNNTQLNNFTNLSLPLSTQFCLFFLLLSLGGLPPFLGFLPKWMVIQNFLFSNYFLNIITSFIMILMSLLTLFFYLRLTFSAFIFSNSKWNLHSSYIYLNKTFVFTSMISLLGFIMSFMIL